MTSTKISGFPSGTPAVGTDETVIARDGANYNLTVDDVTAYVAANAAAGSTGEIQFNNAGALAADAALTITEPGPSTGASFNAGNMSSGLFSQTYGGNGFSGFYAQSNNAVTGFSSYVDIYNGATYGPYISLKTSDASGVETGTVNLTLTNPTSTYNYDLYLPTSAGSANQSLITDGSGTLSWSDPAAGTAPATASSTGRPGEIRYDSDFVYVCVSNSQWKRAALSTW